MRGATLRRRLLQVRADQRAHVAHAFGALFIGSRRLAELLAQMRLHHLGHQAVDRAPDGGDLLQHRRAVGTGFQRAIERIALAADAAHAGQHLLFLFGGVRHGGASSELYWGIVYTQPRAAQSRALNRTTPRPPAASVHPPRSALSAAGDGLAATARGCRCGAACARPAPIAARRIAGDGVPATPASGRCPARRWRRRSPHRRR
ncbi:hypothetical protein G6F31_015331 [Rhizopus arrhizus]|nr:hypothetical protein G6F31_015331 [Rhizopus arrhizus]